MRYLSSLLLAGFLLALIISPVSAGQEKGDVCHITDIAAMTGHVITIAEPAWETHAAHGDPDNWTPVIVGGVEGCLAAAPVCPLTLEPPQSWSAWFTTGPEFSGFSTINMVATFRNESPMNQDISFGPYPTYNLWMNPSITVPTVQNNVVPSGVVLWGETYTYDLTIPVALATDTAFSFRTVNNVTSQTPPVYSPLVSVVFTCN